MNNNKRLAGAHTSRKHETKLKALLSGFFGFLKGTPKPTDNEVRSEFQKCEQEWKIYCLQNHLDVRTSLLFNAKVSYEWERSRVQKPNE